MSWLEAEDPACTARSESGPELLIVPRSHDIGGFRVARALPSAARRMVGPFVFLDRMGPGEFIRGKGVDVRPHPHIGLATVTYLFDGAVMHRDSLGTVTEIRPGAVNWMTAGRGIAHSERTPPAERAAGSRLYGIQSWFALPKGMEEAEPAFFHHAADTFPELRDGGLAVRVVLGRAFGQASPVAVPWDTLYLDVRMDAGARLPLPHETEERAAYVLEGAVEVAGETYAEGQVLVFRAGDRIVLAATQPSRVLVLGGAAMDGPRHLWWNFVSSSKDRIEQAKADWLAGRFGAVPGETEFIPLPGT
jgi:hypothetical protein